MEGITQTKGYVLVVWRLRSPFDLLEVRESFCSLGEWECTRPEFEPEKWKAVLWQPLPQPPAGVTPAAPDRATEAPNDALYFIRGELVDEAPEM